MIRICEAQRDIYSIMFRNPFPLPDLATKGGPMLSGCPTCLAWLDEAERGEGMISQAQRWDSAIKMQSEFMT